MSSNTSHKKVNALHVSCVSKGLTAENSVALSELIFSFTDDPSPNGMSAWMACEEVSVRSECEALECSFSQQALNYILAHKLTKDPVDALIVSGVFGCTIDLPRIAALLGVPVCLYLNADDLVRLISKSPAEKKWLKNSLEKANTVFIDASIGLNAQEALPLTSLNILLTPIDRDAVVDTFIATIPQSAKPELFNYATYELVMRDHPLLFLMQKPDVRHFSDCNRVLDLGCGVGIFLDALRQSGISAVGVERNRTLVEYGRDMGLELIEHDALSYLSEATDQYDGIYCSHFVEHLPVELVEKLLAGMAQLLNPGGVLVMAFPDPESIRSQLLGFWRDPEHVRFYHPELISSMARAHGLDCEWSSYDEQAHEIESFEISPPVMPELNIDFSNKKQTLGNKLLNFIGLASNNQVSFFQDSLQLVTNNQKLINQQLQARTDKLWAINRTWAWNDNVVLKLRKRP